MKKSVIISLDKIRNLKYGMNAMIMIEELTGLNVARLDLSRMGVKEIRAIVLSGLYHEDKELTLERVGDLIDEYSSIEDVVEKMGEALTLAFGDGTKKEQEANGKEIIDFNCDKQFELAIGLFGMDIEQFWNCTPYEFSLIIYGHAERKRQRLNETIYHAWHCAAFDRQKKLPKLESVYIKKEKKKVEKKKDIESNETLVDIAKRKGLNGFWNKKVGD